MDTQRCHQFVVALEEEQKKIHAFQRELPLCLQLVTLAIESCRKELEQIHGQSECSVQTTSECGAVFEEFIPINKWSSSSSFNKDGAEKISEDKVDKTKPDWLRSTQLWNQSPDPQPKEDQAMTTVLELKRKGGAFQPFHKEKYVAAKADSQPLKAISPTTTWSSTAESDGGKQQKQSHRKQRRCWSSELHRRFLHALHHLGGSHVATPKQIIDFMKVDGLTNDEVKSHLQKYRLHTRRPATPVVTNGGENQQQPQFMMVEGIWLPLQDAANNRVYAPVAVQPGDRSSLRCKSHATSSSTHTPHVLPLS
ncbi:hypothetical protein AALP_AA1G271100 [Arabis alpina]|uniref:HTH myb-type domain-containing protein n=1 Tax=Arabis alpina TaxID=50452 RepID=A0A087HQZ6_ARAAL|nr:hypothetical protein AALP_AA1G271100 [Arabis alpina]